MTRKIRLVLVGFAALCVAACSSRRAARPEEAAVRSGVHGRSKIAALIVEGDVEVPPK
jgi:hypothetical protein